MVIFLEAKPGAKINQNASSQNIFLVGVSLPDKQLTTFINHATFRKRLSNLIDICRQ